MKKVVQKVAEEATKLIGVPTHYETEVSYTVLRACKNCGGIHPLARKPQEPGDKCPDCGTPTVKTEIKTMKETLPLTTQISNFFKNINKDKGEKSQ